MIPVERILRLRAGQQPGKPKPPGNPPRRPEPDETSPVEEPPPPIPLPPMRDEPRPIRVWDLDTRGSVNRPPVPFQAAAVCNQPLHLITSGHPRANFFRFRDLPPFQHPWHAVFQIRALPALHYSCPVQSFDCPIFVDYAGSPGSSAYAADLWRREYVYSCQVSTMTTTSTAVTKSSHNECVKPKR